MKHLSLIATDIDTGPLLKTIDQHDDLWNTLNYRKRGGLGTPHFLADDIIVRFDDPTCYTAGTTCVNYPSYDTLSPELGRLIILTMQLTNTNTIGRAVITKISPGKFVSPHTDTEASTKIFKRYHLCLYGVTGNLVTSGDETVDMRSGELWWFDNTAMHSCSNTGQHDRLHLILDLA